jgi:hypothetical protein
MHFIFRFGGAGHDDEKAAGMMLVSILSNVRQESCYQGTMSMVLARKE